MKTILTAIIIATFTLTSQTSAEYVSYALPTGNMQVKVYKIFVPDNIIHLEYLYMMGEYWELSSYNLHLIALNTMLIKSGFSPIYY